MPAGFLTPRRLGTAGLCLLSLLASCGLAWWQWDRFASPSGTFQNLGYVLQWPLFGLFPAFMVYRIAKLRRAAAAEDERASTAGDGDRQAVELPAPKPERPRPVQSDVRDEDDELAAYNRYLAELNARDQENRQKGKPRQW
ncbi:hypothetical protein [Amycolatopsis pigmentata]|uniref:DNA-binding transcriptional regulator of glucitol operon n=1 Tax=Amycolatopsis pigmentata TaxID=450801 RepID=A0ABW5FUY6_9PSEU